MIEYYELKAKDEAFDRYNSSPNMVEDPKPLQK
jgi:hypothetical protein